MSSIINNLTRAKFPEKLGIELINYEAQIIKYINLYTFNFYIFNNKFFKITIKIQLKFQ